MKMSAVFLVLLLAGVAPAAELPRSVKASPCKTPPTIDGRVEADEWADTKPIEFDFKLLEFKTMTSKTRPCKLWVMNSGNGLYVALRIPDETVNKSMSPIDADLALLAFCRGKELAKGDDRKALAADLYADKHWVEKGKDADDRQQDGRGAMGHDGKAWTFEWALPLNCADANDLQAKAGDTVRFNIAYFDAFQPGFKETHVGATYGSDFDRAQDWGTLELADNVKDDGGAAFKGPAWVVELFKNFSGPAKRLELIDASFVAGQSKPVVRANVQFNYIDPQGKERTGKGRLYLPASAKGGKEKLPLYFNAGYEANDAIALNHVGRGYAFVTNAALEANPLVRTPNADVALLHISRAMPFVDDARVAVGGGSAGGWMTMMVAAETFPLAGACPDVPPVNWGYNAAYFIKQKPLITTPAQGEKTPPLPVLASVVPIATESAKVLGDDTGDATWFAHSPVAQVPTITCPVLGYWSTADLLVPIDQVGKEWLRPFDPKSFPEGFTMEPEKLNSTRQARVRLVDVVPEKDRQVIVVKEEDVKKQVGKAAELPFSKDKRWSIVILDEGRPEPKLGHLKYGVAWSRNDFITHVASQKIAPGQLTATKLERLMDRYAGKEWLPTKVRHLDVPESEKADVVRGLITYTAAGPENMKTFIMLYDKLPESKKVLEAEMVKAITTPK